MEINKNIIVINDDEGKVVLKIGNSDKFIKMSKIEYDIIEYYIEVYDKNEVIQHFKNIIQIDLVSLNLLIDKSAENGIITKHSVNKNFSFLKFRFKRNKKIFEIFNLDFTSTVLEKFIEKKIFLNFIIIFLYFFLFYIMYDILKEPLNFRENYNKTLYAVPISFSSLLMYIYLSSFISVFFHEIGHYFFYKYFKGKSSMFGFGLLFFFLPIFYNKILITLITVKKHKIIINLGGIIFDISLLIFLIYFTKNFNSSYPVLSFLCYTTMISICIRSFFNLNIFLPYTDGYFVFSDLINKPHLFEDNLKNSLALIKKKEISLKNFISLTYTILNYLSIGISWLFFFLPFIIYFYYAFTK